MLELSLLLRRIVRRTLFVERLGIFPPPDQGFHITWMVVTATVYRSIFMVAGGYLTAALAPDRPMRYVTVLGVIGIVAGSLGAIV